MEIKSLDAISQEEVIACLLTAFSNYFVVLPDDVNYWKARYKAARIDWQLSFGMFDGNKLVGFIINGIDVHEGKKTAYNSGTGILPDYRGQAIVDKLYAHALPRFRKAGVEKCLLEVIQENHRAMKVYERIGFKIRRGLNSYKGRLPEKGIDYHLEKVSYQEILKREWYHPKNYSWDNLSKAVELSGKNKDSYLVTDDNDSVLGYFTMGSGGQVVQLETVGSGNISEVIKSMRQITPEVRLGNIPDERIDVLEELKVLGFENTINQYEMEFHFD